MHGAVLWMARVWDSFFAVYNTMFAAVNYSRGRYIMAAFQLVCAAVCLGALHLLPRHE